MAETNGRIKSLLVPKIKTLDLTMFLVYLFLICALKRYVIPWFKKG